MTGEAATATGSCVSPSVDVLVVNYRTPELTKAAVRALEGANIVVFVRDNSGDLDPATMSTLVAGGRLVLVADGVNTFFARGNNELYAMGSSPYVLLLNPDVTLSAEGLAVLLRELRSDEGLWAVVPQLLNEDGSPQSYYRRFPDVATILCDRLPPLRRPLRGIWRRHVYADAVLGERFSPEAPPAACLLLRRDIVGDVLFDEDLTLFFNDTDLCLRMATAGRRIDLVPQVTARHLRGASLSEARSNDRFFVARVYDRDCVSYARKNLAMWRVVKAATLMRRLVEVVARAASASRSFGL